MPDSFDLSFLGADYYALLPDYSANALWAGRPEKIPAGLYHMRITDTRSSLLRGREYLVFSLLILEGAHSHPLESSRAGSSQRRRINKERPADHYDLRATGIGRTRFCPASAQ